MKNKNLQSKILSGFAGKILSISRANVNKISSLIKGKGILRENRIRFALKV